MAKHNHIPALDGLRGFAVLAVMFLHLGGGATSHNPFIHAFGTVTRYGWIGVTLFFVLSGFLITGILWDSLGSRHWWRNFFVRRSLRIFPLYYASLVLTAIVSLAVGFSGRSISYLWIYGSYLQNIPAMTNRPTLALPLYHYWSLAVEEQFYLIWPWVLLRVRTLRQAQTICVVVVVVSMSVNLCLGLHLFSWLAGSLLANGGALAAGGFLALAHRSTGWNRYLKWAPTASVAGLVLFLAVSYYKSEWKSSVGLPFLWFLCAGMLATCLSEGKLSRLMSVRWLRWIGSISYGLYVFHLLLLPLDQWIVKRIAGTAGREVQLGLVFIVGICLSFAAATLSFRYFERPLLSLKKRFPATSPQQVDALPVDRLEPA